MSTWGFCGLTNILHGYLNVNQDHVIHVKRNWSDLPAMLDADRHPKKILSTGLQVQFHGREIHSVHFISTVQLSLTPISWIATGAEDGTVRITRYSEDSRCQKLVLSQHHDRVSPLLLTEYAKEN
jgi:hypothetical protein